MLAKRRMLVGALWNVPRTIYSRLQVLPFSADLPASELRRRYESLSFFLNAGAPSLPHVEERTIATASGHGRVRVYDPGTTAPAPTVVLLQVGGWMFGTIDSYDGVARQIAKRSGLRCLSIEYALAPEHPFPAALEDCIAAVRWAASEEGASLGIDPERIALIGDSAGANLALGTCLALRDSEESLVRGAVLAYGCYSPDLDTPSARAMGADANPERRLDQALLERLSARPNCTDQSARGAQGIELADCDVKRRKL